MAIYVISMIQSYLIFFDVPFNKKKTEKKTPITLQNATCLHFMKNVCICVSYVYKIYNIQFFLLL